MALRATDINLEALIRFAPDEGKLLLGERRMVLFSQRSVGLLTELLNQHMGIEFARALLAQFGYRCGADDYEAIAATGDWEAEVDRLSSGPMMHMWEGIVRPVPEIIEFDRATGHFHMAGTWHNSYEAENYLESFGPASQPVCASLTGYASGWSSAFMGIPILGIETGCVAMGDPHCAFDLRPVEAWGNEAAPWLADLRADSESIGRLLEARVQARNQDLANIKAAVDQHCLVTVADTELNLLDANSRYLETAGVERRELLETGTGRLEPVNQSAEEQTAMREELAAGKIWSADQRMVDRDGGEHWLSSTVVPLAGSDGRPGRYISVSTDITAQKQAEAVLREAKAHLEETARAKGDFLATVTHELRTPLNVVLGFSRLLGETDLDTQQAEFLEMIETSGQRLLALVNDVLDYAKIDAGRMSNVPRAMDLRDAVSRVLRLAELDARPKGLELELRCPEGLRPIAWADPDRTDQVLTNLVSNAVKFTDAGRVSVTLSEARGQLRVAVEDSGIGVSEETRQRLFQSFVQADSSTTRRFGGTGLGLAISKQLVEAMGGEIGMESTEGEGSVFWFTLPTSARDPEDAAPKRRSHTPTIAPPEGSGPRVLLVEDNEFSLSLALRLLEGLGCAVDAAVNGVEAIERRFEVDYDLILMDCLMPELDGFDATREIRRIEAREKLAPVPIVACSASVRPEHQDACVEAGMNGFVAKPLESGALQATLQQHVRQRLG